VFHAIADKAKYPSSALSPTGRSQQLRSSRSANRIEGNAPQIGVCILIFFFLRHLFFFHKNQRGRVQQDGCSNVSQWPKPEWEAPTVWLHDDQIRGDLFLKMFYFFLWASEWKRELVGREQYCVQHKGDVDFKYICTPVNGKSFAENNVKRILCFDWNTRWFNVSVSPLIPFSRLYPLKWLYATFFLFLKGF